jgi:hypothetical protein
MTAEKTLRRISIIEQHPDVMSIDKIIEWLSVLRTLEGVRVVDIDAVTNLLSTQGALNGKFSLYFDDVAKITITLTPIYPGSREYSVTSSTKYLNVEK